MIINLQHLIFTSLVRLEKIAIVFQIRENYRQKEKSLNDFTEFIARTSNYTILKVKNVTSNIP